MDTEKTKTDRTSEWSNGCIEDSKIKALDVGRAVTTACVDRREGNQANYELDRNRKLHRRQVEYWMQKQVHPLIAKHQERSLDKVRRRIGDLRSVYLRSKVLWNCRPFPAWNSKAICYCRWSPESDRHHTSKDWGSDKRTMAEHFEWRAEIWQVQHRGW